MKKNGKPKKILLTKEKVRELTIPLSDVAGGNTGACPQITNCCHSTISTDSKA